LCLVYVSTLWRPGIPFDSVGELKKFFDSRVERARKP
jgi:hypothetical protein